jgi:polysaccharide export outer membrane protein
MLLAAASAPGARAADSPEPEAAPLMQLGPGDAISLRVYGQPDMDATQYIADDGTIRVALAGAVNVGGLSPAQASERVEHALRSGKYLINPHVTITVAESRSQRVSVLGEVRTPGRYAIENNTSVMDVLALAGGGTPDCAETVYILRPGPNGSVTRLPVNLGALAVGEESGTPAPTLRAGDSLYAPRADRYYIYGEVQRPNTYRLEPGTTIVQALVMAGGVTPRGSERRIDIQRRDANGKTIVRRAAPNDVINADDIIRVRESLF